MADRYHNQKIHVVSISHWLIDTITKIKLFLGISKHSQGTQIWLKEVARDFLQNLFLGLQKRMYDVLRIVRFIEPFSLPNFKDTAPQLSDYRHPFFKTDDVSRSHLER